MECLQLFYKMFHQKPTPTSTSLKNEYFLMQIFNLNRWWYERYVNQLTKKPEYNTIDGSLYNVPQHEE